MNSIHRVLIIIGLLILFISFQTTFGQPDEKETARIFEPINQSSYDFSVVDNYVHGLKSKKKISEEELVTLITQKSQTKIEKARAIFIWIADNIAYDTSYKITSKEEALKQGKGVCEAYSGMYKDFCEIAGLEVVAISGDSKQYYYKKPSDLDKGGHAWNAVKVEGNRWMLVDATWGAGHVNNRAFTRQLSTYWFDPAPEIYIFSHLPKEDKWQLLEQPVSRDVFLRLPPLVPSLVLWGFNPKATLSYYLKNNQASFPDTYSVEMTWKIDRMPVCNELKKGRSYEFSFELPQNEEVAIVGNGKDWFRFQQNGNKYSLTFIPEKKGQAVVVVKQPNGKFGGVFKYEISD